MPFGHGFVQRAYLSRQICWFVNYLVVSYLMFSISPSMTGLRTPDYFSLTPSSKLIGQHPGSQTRKTKSGTGRPSQHIHTAIAPHRSSVPTMSIPSSSPDREGSRGALPQLECPSSPSGMDQDPPSTGSPVLSPDSSSHDAVLSAPAVSPADSENLSPDELELLAKLEEQNRWELPP